MSDPQDRPRRRLDPRLSIVFLGVVLIAGLIYFLTDREPAGERSKLSDPAGPTGPSTAAKASRSDAVEGGRETREIVDLYRDLLKLARSDRRAFRSRVAILADSQAPRERLDALRAWYEIEGESALPAIARALGDSDADASVREFAYGVLEPRCRDDRRARDAMIGYLRLGLEDKARRSSAFAKVFQWGDKEQMAVCLPLVHREKNPDIVIAAVQGMRASVIPETRNKVQSLHWRHPDAEVRKRLRTLGIGR